MVSIDFSVAIPRRWSVHFVLVPERVTFILNEHLWFNFPTIIPKTSRDQPQSTCIFRRMLPLLPIERRVTCAPLGIVISREEVSSSCGLSTRIVGCHGSMV